jgi:exosortase family protein XrtM
MPEPAAVSGAAVSHALMRRWVWRRRPGFVALALGLTGVFYGILYLGHSSESLIGQAMAGYLGWLARACGRLIGAFDHTVTVQGRSLGGRFPLEIVLDCGAFDVQAIFAAAVLAFPARWQRRAAGLAGGLAALTAFNLLRISSLYFVGALAPGWFHTMHEEVFQIAIVVVACLLFAFWAMWARPRSGEAVDAPEASVAAT